MFYSVSAGSYTYNTPSDVLPDTGGEFVAGPADVLDGLSSALGAKWDADKEGYYLDCDATPPNIVFQIGAFNFPIDYKHYIMKVCPSISPLKLFIGETEYVCT